MQTAFQLLVKTLLAAMIGMTCLSVLLTLGAAFGQYDCRLDLLSHFRPWYFLIELIALCIFFSLRQYKWVAITSIFLIANSIPLIPLYYPQKAEGETAHRLKLMQFNVCAPAKDYAPLSHYLLQEKPDLVVLEECGERCFQNLNRDKMFTYYPHAYRKTPLRHRLVVLSKFPITGATNPIFFADPAIELLTIDFKKNPINLLVMHSTRPSSGKRYYENQIEQFRQIGQIAAKSKFPFLMAGDLNVSPWNYSFNQLIKKSHLKNSMDGFGFQPSFPIFVSRYNTFPLIPIDHVLVSKQFQVLSRRTGQRLQSDHLPVIVELRF